MIRIRNSREYGEEKKKRTAGEKKKKRRRRRRSDEAEGKYRSRLFLSALLIYRYCHGPAAY